MGCLFLKTMSRDHPHEREKLCLVWLKLGLTESVCDNHLQALLEDTDQGGKRSQAGGLTESGDNGEGKRSLKCRNVPSPGSQEMLKQACRYNDKETDNNARVILQPRPSLKREREKHNKEPTSISVSL